MADLTFLSLNVRGLRSDSRKRKKVFENLREKFGDVIFLQETHSTKQTEYSWTNQWGGKIIFSHGTSNSKGVAILISTALEEHVSNIISDAEGRYIILDIVKDNIKYTLANIYAPTQNFETQQIAFINTIHNLLSSRNPENIVVGGDFNVVLDPIKDKRGGNREANKTMKYRSELIAFAETLNLCDIWRDKNSDKFGFTWHCKKSKIFSRLDYWFISDHLANNVNKTDILPTINSDHSIIKLSVKLSTPKRGPSYWKFNSSLLKDKEFVNKLKAVIETSSKKHFHTNKNLMWELVKMEIRSATISYCKYKSKKERINKETLILELSDLHKKLAEDHLDTNIVQEMTRIENELKMIENEKINGIILRSKVKWAEDGEKNSKFFFNLEKRNYINKHITQLNIEGTVITDPKLILDEEKHFYEKLYSEQKSTDKNETEMNNMLSSINIPQISPEEKNVCELQINVSECAKELKLLKNGKTPGIDGLPTEFYKFFWSSIKNLVTDSINYSFQHGEMSYSQRLGVITLIPKKDKDRSFLKNWRPISLLTTDYKLTTKMLASRLSVVLPTIINNDQTAYIKGRYIGENIRTITDIITFCKQKNLTSILLLIDFEKAFDTVKWSFLYKVLKKFNFGTIFQKWIKMLYTNIQSTVINNGYFSPYFNIRRGVRQGCPISAYLFLLIVEILAICIRNNRNIPGIFVSGKELKLSQLADDTTLFIKNHKTIPVIFEFLKKFHNVSGLKTNLDKTQAFLIGKHIRFKENYNLKWKKGPINILGLSICDNESDNYKYNFQPKIKQIKSLFTIWKQRRLSLKGKITIINSLATSLLIYPCTCLDTPQQAMIEINKLFSEFLWDSTYSKISKTTIIRDIKDGGLKMINFETKIKTLKLAWIKRVINSPHNPWNLILKEILHGIPFEYILRSNSNCSHLINNIPSFYRDIYKTWKSMHHSEPINKISILQENIWLNKHITIDGKSFVWKKWLQKGIQIIDDLLEDSRQFLSFVNLQKIFGISCSFLEYLQIRQAIPLHWRDTLLLDNSTLNRTHPMPLYIYSEDIRLDFLKLSSQNLYWMEIDILTKKHTINCINRWNTIYNIHETTWSDIFQIPFKSCRETQLQSFQYRIIHRILPCNNWLFNLKIFDTDICSYHYCNSNEKDTIHHYLIACPPVSAFWNSFVTWWNTTLDLLKLCPLSEENIILGFPGSSHEDIVINYCLILAKFYIYTCKRNQTSIFFLSFLRILKNKLTIEEEIHVQNSCLDKFNLIWSPLLELL